ncbi:hypothetical protein CDD80_3355 [Ophiocordyceps camponoti-rufipedis]|uniref:Uncharacterized protein n=1 Tax=Ophiocordyceps camponoti-rufipedis TaxID=2004952 RepID=A0A2C5ZMK8_9HYPO|nr:hypothetical protein CDD80_3355 [Ophiocordyceps camponoti-rufipedis]
MELRALLRPTATASIRHLFCRGHKTTARTKRALKIAPHDSFLPDRSVHVGEATDSIIYNPPASEASPAHTPFLFLPREDPRRRALRELRGLGGTDTTGHGAVTLPPALRWRQNPPKYHLDENALVEMRRLRAEDPIKWSVGHIAKKFDCSPIFVSMVAPAPPGHIAWLKDKLARKMARWGPTKMQAWEDRKRRAEMLYRGEL